MYLFQNLRWSLERGEDELASKVTAEGGNILSTEEIMGPVGTSITVQDLFFNTPVRYKFLKQDSTEFRYIKEWVQKAALANLDIAFKLINEDKLVFSSTGNGKMHDIIYTLYGKQIEENLVDVDYKEDNIEVKGVVREYSCC